MIILSYVLHISLDISDGVLETGLGSRDCFETHFLKSRLGFASDLNFKSRSRVLVSKNYGLEIWEVSRLKILVRRRSKILNLIQATQTKIWLTF